MQKPSRYYELSEGVLCIYDAPYKKHAQSVSIVKPSDMGFYRTNFHLRKIWG